MTSRQQKEIQKQNKTIYLILLLIGIAGITGSIYLYSVTIINPWIPVVICIASGCIGFLFDYKRYMATYAIDGFFGYFTVFAQSAVFIGGLSSIVFMSSNYFFGDDVQSKTYEIIERRVAKSNRGGKNLAVTVVVKGRRKELSFPSEMIKEMDAFKTVQIESKVGFWGFDIVVEKELKK